MRFEVQGGDWTKFRQLPGPIEEVDFHPHEKQKRGEWRPPYHERMADVYKQALDALKRAQERGTRYVIFTHGWSTSRPGKTTARSVVRGLMRSPDATPYIIRRECIQHDTVFVAAIHPRRLKIIE